MARRWARSLAVAAAVVLVLWIVYQLRGPLTPFAVAFTLAYGLNPLVNWLERGFARLLPRIPVAGPRIPPRAAAVGVLAVLLVLVLVVLFAVVIPVVVHQVSETVAKVPSYLQVLRAKVEPAYQRLNLKYPEQTEEARQRITAALKANIPHILSPVTRMIASAFSSVMGFVLAVLNLVIIPVFAFYLLYDMNHIKDGMRDLVPQRYRPYVYSRMGEVDRLLSAFVRGQLTVAVILGVFYAIGLTLCGMPMGLLVGFVIGLFNLVPFMSYILGLPLARTTVPPIHLPARRRSSWPAISSRPASWVGAWACTRSSSCWPCWWAAPRSGSWAWYWPCRPRRRCRCSGPT